MAVPPQHRSRFVYHSTHIDNLAGILEHGLLSHNQQQAKGLTHHTIAEQSIQDRRATMAVTCGPGGVVHDYVPLYFTKLSPMLLQVVLAKNVDQMLLLHFAFPISILERDDVVFTDGAANKNVPPTFMSDPQLSSQLRWDAIDLRSWRSIIKATGEDVKHERMAETLVHRELNISDAAFVVVWNPSIKKMVQGVFDKAGVTAPTLRFGGFDESHSFTHFRKDLPKDMQGCSIASGPQWTRYRFEEAVKQLKEESAGGNFDGADALVGAFQQDGLKVLTETAELVDLESANDVHKEDVGRHTELVVEKLRDSAHYETLSPEDRTLVELAAWLHDIGKGPKSRWANCGGKQQKDADHPIRSMEMLPRIFDEEVRMDKESARILCLLVCYHDLVGDILGKGRHREQLVDVAKNMREVDLLIAIGAADMSSIAASWGWTAATGIPNLRSWAATKLPE